MQLLYHKIALLGISVAQSAATVVTDIPKIFSTWGELSVYADNAENAFGVQYVGLPDGCQVESVSTLQRHAQRLPDTLDGARTAGFAEKVANSSKRFTGPLTFLNSYIYIMDNTGFLTGYGANTEFGAGVSFWNRYGRTLFNASVAQLQYSSVFASNGSSRPKITLRTTGQSRIQNSEINWALGFFGPSFNSTPDPLFTSLNSPFNVTIIPEGLKKNNTLAAYGSCDNDNTRANMNIAASYQDAYIKIYLQKAVNRLQNNSAPGFIFNYTDVYAMQMMCAYEYAFIGASEFCNLFTEEEWEGFENALGILYYYWSSYGNPTGRAQGIGYLQELIARINHQTIGYSNSSVNRAFDNNTRDFPLGQQIYADFSHDSIIISVLTAMSIDYFKDPPTITKFPPTDTHFKLSKLTPFGSNLITEVIGCGTSNPDPVNISRISYSPTQYRYNASSSSHKFIRMRLNNGILPLNTIRGGLCGNATHGRHDGLCELDRFLESQRDAYNLSNYQYACFGNYTIVNSTTPIDYDGTFIKGKNYAQVGGISDKGCCCLGIFKKVILLLIDFRFTLF
ncbi:hypothetical protein H634G_07530 [Metarhizium anisopliae BRIP 53293]|uniref:3-phytase n=1 Tax=Metarhizium anisopliae BRIP 53293 TaxID=1291518 RepID=A0A0D9NSY9_METAN|nr:hypothetical protein H634G_07530 [Metarhizium anisopliae BRIP 53293]